MAFDKVERIVLIGACAVDVILNVPHYPTEDEKLRASSCSRRRGGNTCNSAEVIAQLRCLSQSTKNLEIVLVNVLPEKGCATEQFIATSLSPAGEDGPSIDISRCIHRQGYKEPITSYVIASAAANSRTIVTHNELPEMTFEEFKGKIDDLDAENPKQTLYHFEGRIPDVTLQCVQYLRNRKVLVQPHAYISVEVENPRRRGLQKLIDYADVVFFSKDWVTGAGYVDAYAYLQEYAARSGNQARYMFCTWGDQGSYGCGPTHGTSLELSAPKSQAIKVEHVEATKVDVVDPVGAGDTFIGAMLIALMSCENDLDTTVQKVQFANNTAARKLAQMGFRKLLS